MLLEAMLYAEEVPNYRICGILVLVYTKLIQEQIMSGFDNCSHSSQVTMYVKILTSCIYSKAYCRLWLLGTHGY